MLRNTMRKKLSWAFPQYERDGWQQGPEVLSFQKFLADKLNIPVQLWDERLTTAAARRTLLEADVSRKGRKKAIDKLAAVFILDSYMRSRKTQ